MKWTLTPVLLLFTVLMIWELPRPYHEGRLAGVVACGSLSAMGISGVLALWGVQQAVRVVTGIIGAFSLYYLIDQCFLHYPGHLGFGSRRSSQTPLNSILAFIFFGLPCLLITFLGRSTIKRPPVIESLFLTFMLDDAKYGSFEFRTRLRDLADAISDKLCDGINSDYGGESEDEKGKASIEFWTSDVEEFALKIRAEFPEEPLLANCAWARWDTNGTETVLANPYAAADRSNAAEKPHPDGPDAAF